MPMHRSHLRAPALTLALFADIACWWYGPFIDPEFTGASDPAGTDGLATDGPVTGDPVDPTGQPAPAACPSGTELVKAFEDTLRPLALRQDPDTCGIFLASTESVMGPPQGLLVHHIGEQGELIEQFTEPISSYGSAAFSDIEVGAADSLTLTARFVELPALKTSYKSDPLSWIPHAIARGDDHWLVAGVTGTQVHLAALGGAPFDESVTVSGDPVVNAVAAGATSTWVGGWYAVGDHTDPFLLRKDDALAAPLVPQQLPAALSTVYNDAISAVLVDASTVYALGYYKTEPSEYTLFLLAFAEDAEPTEQDLHEVGVAAGIPVISPALVRVGERLVWTGYAEEGGKATPQLGYVDLANLDNPVSLPLTGTGKARITALAAVPGSQSAVLLAGLVDEGPLALGGLNLPAPGGSPRPFIARLELP